MPDSATFCWMAYYSDFSGMVIFDNELDALRYAVDHTTMKVVALKAGDVHNQVNRSR